MYALLYVGRPALCTKPTADDALVGIIYIPRLYTHPDKRETGSCKSPFPYTIILTMVIFLRAIDEMKRLVEKYPNGIEDQKQR